MIKNGKHYPLFEHNESLSDFLNVAGFSTRYLLCIFRSTLLSSTDSDTQKITLSGALSPILEKLAAREKKILSRIKFHTNQSFSDYKAIKRRAPIYEDITNLNLSPHANSAMMIPVAEMVMLKAQGLHDRYEDQLKRIEGHLKFMAHLQKVDAGDNPLAPLNILNIFLSSIDFEYLAIHEIQKFIIIVAGILDHQLEDFYAQLEFGLATMGYESNEPLIGVENPETQRDHPLLNSPSSQQERPSSQQVSSGNRKLDEQYKTRFFQMTEEILEEVILDDDKMTFFFDEWQQWLRYLSITIGFESQAVSEAKDIMSDLAEYLTQHLEKIPDKNTLDRIENYVNSSWRVLKMDPQRADRIISQLREHAVPVGHPIIHRYLG